MITIHVPLAIDDEWFAQFVESAAGEIGYFAVRSSIRALRATSDDEPFFEFQVDDFPDDPFKKPLTYRLTRKQVAAAVERIVAGGVHGLHDTKGTAVLRSLHDPGDLDADVGDWVAQVAAFGEVVYG